MARAIYSGSFDPVTFGHLDILERAARVFDTLEVVVGNHPAKQYVFTLEERRRLLRHAAPDPRLSIRTLEHKLLADYAYESGVQTIVKGIRGIQDYDYERMMHEVNITQQRGIDTHILLARKELNHVSSSAVKELCRYQGFTHEYVPLVVKEALERRLNRQVLVGVTGGIGSGKSYLARRMVEVGAARGRAVHDIDFDRIAHDVLEVRTEPVCRRLREELRDAFGLGEFNRKALGELVFNDPARLARLNAMMLAPLLTRLRAEMAGKQGVLLINAALLAEADMLHLCNNNVVLATAPEGTRLERLRGRGLGEAQIRRRLESQYTTDEKLRRIRDRIGAARWGSLAIVESDRPLSDGAVADLLDRAAPAELPLPA